MRCKALRYGFSLVAGGLLLLSTALFAQKGLSHVRVVRLSYVAGTVGVKRPASTEWAKAQVNTPIQEGFELSTGAGSYAEVQFENGSTARLGESSRLTFDQLAMDEEGGKLNRLTCERGYATFHFMPEHHDAYSVKVADATLTPNGKSEFRADMDHGQARVEVFTGSVEVAQSTKTVKVGKDHILKFNAGDAELAFNIQQGIVKDAWDKWSAERDSQSRMALTDQAVPARGPVYGWSDLDVYGEWGLFPGFGYGWSPFVSAGWSPFTMGMWNWYPGMGYTWISGEPWGWLPYHYGNWNFSPGFGWFWMPGSFNQWSPALVSWYSGPGWIGWAPRGMAGAAGQAVVTAVPGGVVQNGQMITPQSVNRVPLAAGTPIARLPFQPGAGAMLSGPPLPSGSEVFTAHREGLHGMAPSAVLMGGNAGTEASLQGGHFSHQPLRVRMGTTLGGHYAVGGNVGEFRGDAFKGMGGARGLNGPQSSAPGRGAGSVRPTLMPHGNQAKMSAPSGGGRAAPSGGGYSGSAMPSGGNTGSVASGNSASGSGAHSGSASTGRH
jgi:hypothetical protein